MVRFQNQIRLCVLCEQGLALSLIFKPPSVLFFYFLLNCILRILNSHSLIFSITFLWNHQKEIMPAGNPLPMFVSLCEHWLTCVRHVYTDITAWVWFWRISSFSNCRLEFRPPRCFFSPFSFTLQTTWQELLVIPLNAFNVLYNSPNDVVRIHNLIFHGNWSIILQHRASF